MRRDPPPSAEEIADRVDAQLRPVDNGFTIDPDTGADGVSDLQNTDWRVRTLAVRDLVRRGLKTLAPVRDLLTHDNEHVRQTVAMALGLLRDEAASDLLTDRLCEDPHPVVRS